MKYLIIDGELLKNEVLKPTDKIILSYMYNLEKTGNNFYGALPFLAKEIGLPIEYIKGRFNQLFNWQLIRADEKGVYLNKPWIEIQYFDNTVKIEDALQVIASEMAKKFGGK